MLPYVDRRIFGDQRGMGHSYAKDARLPPVKNERQSFRRL